MRYSGEEIPQRKRSFGHYPGDVRPFTPISFVKIEPEFSVMDEAKRLAREWKRKKE